MSLRLYLRDNRIPIAIVVLAIAAVGSWFLQRWVLGTAPTNDFVGPPVSDYTLYTAKVWSYDTDGLLSFTMTSPRMDRREGDESLYINAPQFTLASKKPGIPDWQGNSPYGWVNKTGTLLKLQGSVYMYRPAYADSPMATLNTTDVTGWPKENRMETAAPAILTQGPSKMNGIGMRANLDDNHLELLNDVHGILYPRQRNASAQRDSTVPVRAAASPGKNG